jgi:hypothetical protein
MNWEQSREVSFLGIRKSDLGTVYLGPLLLNWRIEGYWSQEPQYEYRISQKQQKGDKNIGVLTKKMWKSMWRQ